jgi:hemerythrin-like domain-containing protein
MKGRRLFLQTTATLGLGALVPASSLLAEDKKKEEEEVTPAEDLMREHGVLNRVLLIFEEGLRRMHDKDDVTPEMFHKPASLVRKFVEDYHEKLEENHIFPAFEKQKKLGGLAELVGILKKQHIAGRELTDIILREATGERFRKEESRKEIVTSVEAFIGMYRPHEAREDTVLFPALPKVFSQKQLKELGEQFEKKEDELFGDEGFEKIVDEVAAIEKQLGIHDLDKFTPKQR